MDLRFGDGYDGDLLQAAISGLSEIAYLLRHREEEAYRARAFTRVCVVLALERPDLARLHWQGDLQRIPGVGAGIAKVLDELIDTGRSDYLDRLREEAGLVEVECSRLTLAGYQGDLHAHSTWSDGDASILEMATEARSRGYHYLAITDHSPRITVVHGLDGERLSAQAAEIELVREALDGFAILRGIEVDILEDGSLDLPDDVLARLNIVVASPHVKLRQEPAAMTERMLRAVENPNVDVIGHPTGRRPGQRPGATYDFEAVFKRAAGCNTALEIDCDPARMDLSPEMARLAASLGCTFALDSDAHRPAEMAYVEMGLWMARRAGLEADQILNWRPRPF